MARHARRWMYFWMAVAASFAGLAGFFMLAVNNGSVWLCVSTAIPLIVVATVCRQKVRDAFCR